MPTSGKTRIAKNKTVKSKTLKNTGDKMEKSMKHAASDVQQENSTESTATPPVFFWRESHPETGYLSQWFPSPFTDDSGKTYKTAEHYMVHHKALLFDDASSALAILKADHPRKVKALGRKVTHFDPAVWDAHREQIVRQGTYLKFTRSDCPRQGTCSDAVEVGNGGLRALLLRTSEAELVEASPFDPIWGIGFAAANATENRESWGLNLLGKALVEVRNMFRTEDEQKAKKSEAGKEVVI